MRRNQKGFTLMELMVVIVIVAILAAVAVPLYVNYVRDAQRTEAKGAIGAIITAEQAHFQRYGDYEDYTNAEFAAVGTAQAPAAIDRLDCDITEAQRNWSFVVNLQNGFTVIATGISDATDGPPPLTVTYRLNPPTGEDNWVDGP